MNRPFVLNDKKVNYSSKTIKEGGDIGNREEKINLSLKGKMYVEKSFGNFGGMRAVHYLRKLSFR